MSCRIITEEKDERIRNALITNLSNDLPRYQNMVCRYDTMALKSLDIFSVHGFPVGMIQCESNILGIANGGGRNVDELTGNITERGLDHFTAGLSAVFCKMAAALKPGDRWLSPITITG